MYRTIDTITLSPGPDKETYSYKVASYARNEIFKESTKNLNIIGKFKLILRAFHM